MSYRTGAPLECEGECSARLLGIHQRANRAPREDHPATGPGHVHRGFVGKTRLVSDPVLPQAIVMDDEAREEALKNQEARDREETRRRQREIDKAFIKKNGLKAWVSAPSADAGHSHIPHKYRFDIHRTGNPMATIQTITDAATASSAIRTII